MSNPASQSDPELFRLFTAFMQHQQTSGCNPTGEPLQVAPKAATATDAAAVQPSLVGPAPANATAAFAAPVQPAITGPTPATIPHSVSNPPATVVGPDPASASHVDAESVQPAPPGPEPAESEPAVSANPIHVDTALVQPAPAGLESTESACVESGSVGPVSPFSIDAASFKLAPVVEPELSTLAPPAPTVPPSLRSLQIAPIPAASPRANATVADPQHVESAPSDPAPAEPTRRSESTPAELTGDEAFRDDPQPAAITMRKRSGKRSNEREHVLQRKIKDSTVRHQAALHALKLQEDDEGAKCRFSCTTCIVIVGLDLCSATAQLVYLNRCKRCRELSGGECIVLNNRGRCAECTFANSKCTHSMPQRKRRRDYSDVREDADFSVDTRKRFPKRPYYADAKLPPNLNKAGRPEETDSEDEEGDEQAVGEDVTNNNKGDGEEDEDDGSTSDECMDDTASKLSVPVTPHTRGRGGSLRELPPKQAPVTPSPVRRTQKSTVVTGSRVAPISSRAGNRRGLLPVSSPVAGSSRTATTYTYDDDLLDALTDKISERLRQKRTHREVDEEEDAVDRGNKKRRSGNKAKESGKKRN